MTTMTVKQVLGGLRAVIDRVREGETIVIVDRGVPVARLTAIKREAQAAPPLDLLRTPAPWLAPGTGGVQALLEERRQGR